MDANSERAAQEHVTVYGCEDCHQSILTRERLSDLGIPFSYVDIEYDVLAQDHIREMNDGETRTPFVSIGDSCELTQPPIAELEDQLRRHGLLGRGTKTKAGVRIEYSEP